MLNHNGGWILMGVSDNGEILGVDPTKAADMKKAIMDAINNPELFLPWYYPDYRIGISNGLTWKENGTLGAEEVSTIEAESTE